MLLTRIRTALVAAATLAPLLTAPAALGQEREQAFMLAASCAACHGTGGASPGTIPALAGVSASYLEQALRSFKSGERTGTVMNRIARGYSDEEIRLLAGFFSGAN